MWSPVIRLPTRQCVIIGVIVAWFVLVATSEQAAGGEPADPLSVIKGIEFSRLEIPPSNLEINYLYRIVAREEPIQIEQTIFVAFSENKRHFSRDSVQTVFDGRKVIHYFQDVTIRDLGDRTGDPFFDPRLLGITFYYSWSDSLESTLPYRDALEIGFVGKEVINGNEALHVYIVLEENLRYDYWVDAEEYSRVYQAKLSTDSYNWVTTSAYDNKLYPWLPSYVKTNMINPEGNLHRSRELSIVSADATAEFGEETWSIAGISPPVGTLVLDLRIRERLGYWHGKEKGVVDAIPAALFFDEQDASPHVHLSQRILIMIVCIAAILIPGIIYWRLSRRKMER